MKQFGRLKCSLFSPPPPHTHTLLSLSAVLFACALQNHLWAQLQMANLDALCFSVNKSSPSEVERTKYFPQLVSRTIHTCPSCAENVKHFMDTQWKNQNFGFSQIHRISVPGSQTNQLNMINHVNLGLFNVYCCKC